MSTLKDNILQYKTAIKNNFDTFDPNHKGIIQTDKLNSFISSINSKNNNPFIYYSIKSLAEESKDKEGISSDEYISYIDTKLSDTESNEGLKNIFNVFCNSATGNISWNTLPLIAKELGENDIAEKLLNIIKQSRVYTKDLNFKEFIDIMNNENENNTTSVNNDITENSENIKIIGSNMKINEYMEDYEEKPTYKQRKMMQKNEKEKEIDERTFSSKNSYQDNDDIIVEEKHYNNNDNTNGRIEENNEINEGNDKNNKRYHRRYRSKKVKSNNNNFNDNSDNGNGNAPKSYTKYRKNHINY